MSQPPTIVPLTSRYTMGLTTQKCGHLRAYLSLIRPGIIIGNGITLSGAFLFATHITHHLFAWPLFLATLIGVTLMIACGCILNNILDHDLDFMLQRNAQRPLAQGSIMTFWAAILAIVLGVLSIIILYTQTNLWVLCLALSGLFLYIAGYTFLFKRRSAIYGLLIGAMAAATPSMAGFLAVTDHFTLSIWLIFGILFFWQLAHMISLRLYHHKDFQYAGIPTLVRKRTFESVRSIVICLITLCGFSSVAIGFVEPGDFFVYGLWAWLLCFLWLIISLKRMPPQRWARRVFIMSFIVIFGLFFALF